MAPLLLIVVSVAGAVFGLEAARAEILNQLNELLGAEFTWVFAHRHGSHRHLPGL